MLQLPKMMNDPTRMSGPIVGHWSNEKGGGQNLTLDRLAWDVITDTDDET